MKKWGPHSVFLKKTGKGKKKKYINFFLYVCKCARTCMWSKQIKIYIYIKLGGEDSANQTQKNHVQP